MKKRFINHTPVVFNLLKTIEGKTPSNVTETRYKPIKAYGRLQAKIKPFYKKITQF